MFLAVIGYRREFMEYMIAGILALALAVYLIYALLRPERF
jgi:K+-transporting ATPase KdpF subunit